MGMFRKPARSAIIMGMLLLMAALSASAQDFNRSYRLPAGASVKVANVSGNVAVRGYNGDAVIVTAWKEGRDRDRVQIEDASAGNAVSIRVSYPERCNCYANVRIEVMVPSEVNYQLENISSVSGDVSVVNAMGSLKAKSVSGNVTVSGFSGAVNASSVSGNVRVGGVSGSASGKSTSGNVEVEIESLANHGDMEFTSVSGDVSVRLPANLDSQVSMSTMSGDLRTDFPLTVDEPKWGPGKKANGRVGSGTHSLKLSSVSGNVRLLRS